jgi:hypothetical protein
VRSAANLNTRILKLDLANEYARQRRPSANLYAQQAKAAHAALLEDTAAYNALGSGKWRHMMDMAPRRLPVFEEPAYPSWPASARRGCGIVYPAPYSALGDRIAFTHGQASTAWLTLVSYGEQPAAWSVREGAQGVRVDASSGELAADNGYEQRIAVHYDGSAKPALSFECAGLVVNANLRIEGQAMEGLAGERERMIVMSAASAAPSPDWEDMPGLGSTGAGRRARLELAPRQPDTLGKAQPLEYHFANVTDSGAQVRLLAVPVHPLTSTGHVRIGVTLDDGMLEVLDFQTFERSDEWKRNVLSNTAVRGMQLPRLEPGRHTLRVYALDPGVVLDRIDVVMDGAPQYYGLPPGG